MTTHAYREVLDQIQNLLQILPLEDQQRLLEELKATVQHKDNKQKLHNIMEFKGIAKGAWKDVDVEKYIKQERESWDG